MALYSPIFCLLPSPQLTWSVAGAPPCSPCPSLFPLSARPTHGPPLVFGACPDPSFPPHTSSKPGGHACSIFFLLTGPSILPLKPFPVAWTMVTTSHTCPKDRESPRNSSREPGPSPLTLLPSQAPSGLGRGNPGPRLSSLLPSAFAAAPEPPLISQPGAPADSPVGQD